MRASKFQSYYADPSFVDEYDLALLSQNTKDYYTKCLLLDKSRQVIKEIQGSVISGNFSIDADSTVRRTISLTVSLDRQEDFTEYQYFTHFIKLYIGVYSIKRRGIIYYNMGIYCFDERSTTYSATENSLSLSMVDMMGMLDADHRGILYGASTYTIKAIDDNGKRIRSNSTANGLPLVDINGEKYKNTIANAMRALLGLAGINNTIIEEIGAYSVVSATDKESAKKTFFNTSGTISKYKKTQNGTVTEEINDSRYEYNEVPYNLEFDLGSSIQDALTTLRDLYDGYEAYFDTNGVFHCNMIPTMYEQPCVLSKEYMAKCVISENLSSKIYDVKNVVEVWGRDLSTDAFASLTEQIMHTSNADTKEDAYVLTLNDFSSQTVDNKFVYEDGLTVGMVVPKGSASSYNKIKLQVQSKNTQTNEINSSYPTGYIYDPSNGSNIVDPQIFEEGKTYVLQWSSSINGWYYLGQYQVHAVAVLTDGSATVDDVAKKYNCSKNAVYLDVQPDSPYVVEKIGTVLQLCNGGDYQNITSDLNAKSSAKHELWKSARRTDKISVSSILIPFLDVNQKLEYVRSGTTEPTQYIIKSISGDIGSGTMNLELMTFYPLYERGN